MATTSARSFNQYSGLNRHQQIQGIKTPTERLGDPQVTQAMRDVAPWALGLAEQGATPVGRSTRNPYRALEMLSRGTARPGQVQAALGLRQLQMQDQDPIDAAREQQFGAGGGFQQQQPLGFQQPIQYGNIFRGSNQSPSNSASRSAIGGSMRGAWRPKAGGGASFAF